jgi:hypothetical protein
METKKPEQESNLTEYHFRFYNLLQLIKNLFKK